MRKPHPISAVVVVAHESKSGGVYGRHAIFVVVEEEVAVGESHARGLGALHHGRQRRARRPTPRADRPCEPPLTLRLLPLVGADGERAKFTHCPRGRGVRQSPPSFYGRCGDRDGTGLTGHCEVIALRGGCVIT